jgi:hypothetical protein
MPASSDKQTELSPNDSNQEKSMPSALSMKIKPDSSMARHDEQ